MNDVNWDNTSLWKETDSLVSYINQTNEKIRTLEGSLFGVQKKSKE